MSTQPRCRDDPLNHYACNIIADHHRTLADNYAVRVPDPAAYLQDQPALPVPKCAPKVGIIGGGIGGLYAALLLQEQGIPYEILEASPRLGGRLFTHRMGDRPNDYYDVGAMRFPTTEVMQPLFDLFAKIGLKTGEYLFKDRRGNSALLFNDVQRQRANGPVTPQKFDITGVPAEPYGNLGWEKNVANVVDPFSERLIHDFRTKGDRGWKVMMDYDKYSMRAYMSGNRSDKDKYNGLDKLNLMPYPLEVVNWCETFDKSSGWYDRALSETVLEALAFSWDGQPIDWKYIVGGSSQLPLTLDEYMSKQPGYTRPLFNTRVVGMSCVDPADMPPSSQTVSQTVSAAAGRAAKRFAAGDDLPNVGCIAVHVANGPPRYYSHVITTTTLPCLRTMNLTSARLDWQQKAALRMLQYGPSTKIGMRFRRRWWEDDAWMQAAGAYGAIEGGQSYTDNMSRTVVYPSYGVGQPESGACMIVSYAWTNDALALTGLMGRVLQDLVEVHRFNEKAAAELEEMLEEMHPYSWSTDPNTMGAFAFFGPGDFKKLYPALTRPAAGGRLHFAGEVCSVRHAWVLGALEASTRAVNEVLQCSYAGKKAGAFEEAYGRPEGWTANMMHVQRLLGMFGAVGEVPPAGVAA